MVVRVGPDGPVRLATRRLVLVAGVERVVSPPTPPVAVDEAQVVAARVAAVAPPAATISRPTPR